MRTKLLFALFFIGFILSSNAQTITRMVGTTAFKDSLWVFDTINFNVYRNLTLTPSSGPAITGINGLTKNPNTGRLYVILKQSGITGRTLGKLDLLTGSVTVVGNLGDNFSSLTFKGDTLFGVTGNGATVPKTLYKIDTSSAAVTLVTPLGNGADGEIICYNPTDNYIYHWTGNGTVVFEKILSYPPYTVTNISISGTPNGETFGAVHTGGANFITSNINSYFDKWTAAGTVTTNLGNMSPDDIRGMALVTCQRTITGTPVVCGTDSTMLSIPSVGSSYQWFFNGSAIPTGTNQSVYVKAAGYYKVMISDQCGTDSLAPGVNVQQFPKPTVSLSGGNGFCPGGSVVLTGTGGGSSQWYYNGTAIPSATVNTYTVTTAGIYNMTKTNLNGCKDSAATGKNIVAYPTPSLTAGSSSSAICSGATVTLNVSGANTYTWSTTANGSSITVSPSVTTSYSVSGTSTVGCVGTTTVSQTVSIPMLVTSSSSSVICSGNSATLTVSGATSYTWNTSATGSSIVVSPTVNTTYTVNATDSIGCTANDTITQMVSPCTGISSINASAAVKVYPNPGAGLFTVTLNNVSENTIIEVYNSLGQRVMSQAAAENENSINIKAQPAGIYILKVSDKNKVVSVSRIVKE